MNNLPFGNHNYSLDAENLLTYPGLKSGTKIQKIGEKSRTKDQETLCQSKHNITIGVTTNDSGNIIPFESSIVVLFTASDSSGAGLVGEAYSKLIMDPLEYEKTVATGLDIVNQNYADCAKINGGWNCKGEFVEAAAYNTTYIVTAPVRAVAAGGNWAVKKVSSWFSAENFEADVWGTKLHYENASAHKVRIKITNEFEGVLRTVYDSELAGSSATFTESGQTFVQPAVSYFAIDSPGLWTVTVNSIASGTCVNPKLAVRETFTVATPENWGDEPTVEPISELEPETFVETISGGTSKTNVGLETIVGGVLIGGALIYALLG
jgi:hypothetical protein